jgi:hypothetical protein
MSSSVLVCGHSGCGLPVHAIRSSYRHSLGGNTGAILAHRKHKPVPVLRADYDRAYAWDTPPEEARALLAGFRALDREVNPPASRAGQQGQQDDAGQEFRPPQAAGQEEA